MNVKQRVWLYISIFVLIALLFVVAFLIPEDSIPRFSFWTSLVIGFASVATSIIAVGISAMSFRRAEELKREKLKDEARLFIHDNNDEIDYLPYCVYASCYDRHGHHTRRIYDNFCRLSDELQKEVLKEANYDIQLIADTRWIREKIGLINKFAEQYGFGDTFLYENGKHFLNGYKSKEEPYIDEHKEELRDVFGMYDFFTRLISRKAITIDQYFESYGYRRFRDPKWLKRYPYDPPGDVLIEIKELRDAEKTSSSTVAFWMCHVIENIYSVIEEYFYGGIPKGIIMNDAQPEYFEDKFYMILNLLYCMDDYSKYELIVKEPYDKKERDKIENDGENN